VEAKSLPLHPPTLDKATENKRKQENKSPGTNEFGVEVGSGKGRNKRI
jgi:hypothetical protein